MTPESELSDPVPPQDVLTHAYSPGGLMRCCTATIALRSEQGPPRDGERLPCSYCSSGMWYDVDRWVWNGK